MVLSTLKKRFFLIIFLMCSNHICFADTVVTQLSQDQINLGDTFLITYISKTSQQQNPDFSPLQKDFRILNTNYGSEVDMINGVTSIQSFWRLQLTPKRAGELIIPEINFGRDKSTQSKLIVNAGSVIQNKPTPINHPNDSEALFVRGEVDTTTPYALSQVLYTFKLYFRTVLRDPRLEMPTLKDATFIQLSDNPAYQTTVNGKVYHVLEKTFAIIPKKPGLITIPPLQFRAFSIDQAVHAYSDPFNFYQPTDIAVTTKPLNLTVRDIPAHFEGTTWLPAKNILLTEQWSRNQEPWKTGVPVTRTIRIEAQGLRAEQLPDLTFDKIDGVNIYADRAKRSNSIQNNILVGVLEQKITYIANSSDAFTIPAVKINWWNTQTDGNAMTQLIEKHIKVEALPQLTKTPLPLPVITAPSIPAAPAFYQSIWFWVACLMLMTWILTLWVILRKKTRTENDKAQITIKNLTHACRAGEAVAAQEYLLQWAKKHCPESAFNLTTLREFINDESFQLAIKELEEVLYAKGSRNWEGRKLLKAFNRIKKQKHKPVKHNMDPLPPLNPLN